MPSIEYKTCSKHKHCTPLGGYCDGNRECTPCALCATTDSVNGQCPSRCGADMYAYRTALEEWEQNTQGVTEPATEPEVPTVLVTTTGRVTELTQGVVTEPATTPVIVISPPNGEAGGEKSCDQLEWSFYGSGAVCASPMLINGACPGNVMFTDAEQMCADADALHCTLDELKSKATKGAGCSLDKKQVWSSDACGDGAHMSVKGNGGGNSYCQQGSSTLGVRCCASLA